MRCLKEIQNIVFGLLYRDRIKTNNKRYHMLYEVREIEGEFAGLKYCSITRGFNYRSFNHRSFNHRNFNYLNFNYRIKSGYPLIYRMDKLSLSMMCTYIELSKNY